MRIAPIATVFVLWGCISTAIGVPLGLRYRGLGITTELNSTTSVPSRRSNPFLDAKQLRRALPADPAPGTTVALAGHSIVLGSKLAEQGTQSTVYDVEGLVNGHEAVAKYLKTATYENEVTFASLAGQYLTWGIVDNRPWLVMIKQDGVPITKTRAYASAHANAALRSAFNTQVKGLIADAVIRYNNKGDGVINRDMNQGNVLWVENAAGQLTTANIVDWGFSELGEDGLTRTTVMNTWFGSGKPLYVWNSVL